MIREQRRFPVKDCARCGQNHLDGVVFRRFMRPVVDADGTTWEWWGKCPVSKDPILLKKDDKVTP